MIHSKDRSGWIGASDTSFVVGNWNTPTWRAWWAEKLGVTSRSFETIYTKTGSFYEGKILDYLGIKKRDRQIRIPKLRLRVNLDGETAIIHEIKTHKYLRFTVSLPYWRQAQVEMFAAKKRLEIVSYRLTDEDYSDWLLPIDPDRLRRHPIQYDRLWVQQEYLPRLNHLADCLKRGVYP